MRISQNGKTLIDNTSVLGAMVIDFLPLLTHGAPCRCFRQPKPRHTVLRVLLRFVRLSKLNFPYFDPLNGCGRGNRVDVIWGRIPNFL